MVTHQHRKAGNKKQVKLTSVTPEPMRGHFGMGGLPHGESRLGMFLRKEKITPVVDTAIDHVDDGRVVLEDGTHGPTLTIEDSSRVDPWIVRQAQREAESCRRRLAEFSRRDHPTADG